MALTYNPATGGFQEGPDAPSGGVPAVSSFGSVATPSAAMATLTAAIADVTSGAGLLAIDESFTTGTTAPSTGAVDMKGDQQASYAPPGNGSLGFPRGRVMINRPNRNFEDLEWGTEYLFRFLNKISLGSACTVALIGDSNTVAWSGPILQGLLSGVPGVTVVNYGVGGTTLGQWVANTGGFVGTGKDMASVLATNPDLIICGFGGTNDPVYGGTPETFGAAMTAFLTTLRTTNSKAPGDCSVLLMTAASMGIANSSTTIGPDYQDEVMTAACRSVIFGAAIEYECAFHDKAGFTPDASVDFVGTGQDSWLDTNRVHTQNAYSVIVAQRAFNFVTGGLFGSSGSGVTNTSGSQQTTFPSDTPASYPLGIKINRAISTNGWPYNGFIITIRAVDGNQPIQINWPFVPTMGLVSVDGNIAYRTSSGASPGTWGKWIYLNLLQKVTPAAGFALPNSVEDMSVVASGGLISGTGYVTMTTPAPLTANQTIATSGPNTRPIRNIFTTLTLSDSTNLIYEQILGRFDELGNVVALAASSMSPSRIYINFSGQALLV